MDSILAPCPVAPGSILRAPKIFVRISWCCIDLSTVVYCFLCGQGKTVVRTHLVLASGKLALKSDHFFSFIKNNIFGGAVCIWSISLVKERSNCNLASLWRDLLVSCQLKIDLARLTWQQFFESAVTDRCPDGHHDENDEPWRAGAAAKQF